MVRACALISSRASKQVIVSLQPDVRYDSGMLQVYWVKRNHDGTCCLAGGPSGNRSPESFAAECVRLVREHL